MSSELVEIRPSIVKFTFELMKQNTCLIQLRNKSQHFIGFKILLKQELYFPTLLKGKGEVKTTSPKKYVVKPNIGVINPRGASEFTVIMLAQSVAPPDLLCKDKFLVQSTIVPFGLTEENITSEMFVKGPNTTIEDKKLKVIFVAPTNSTTESPVSPSNGVQHQDLPPDASPQKDKVPAKTEKLSLPKDEEGSQFAKATGDIRFAKDADPRPAEDTEELRITRSVPSDESRVARRFESREVQKLDEEKVLNATVDLKLRKQAEDLTLKLHNLGSKLALAEQTAVQLTEERNQILHEKEMIEQELVLARRKNADYTVKQVYRGYPLLYVFMVSMFSLTFGYLTRP